MLLSACGSTSTGNGGTDGSTANSDPLAGKPIEGHLEIYNWSQYDAPSTYKKFKQLPDVAKAGLSLNETYYSSNDELLAKLNAGGTKYDIIAPSQNAVAQLIETHKLMLSMTMSLEGILETSQRLERLPAKTPAATIEALKTQRDGGFDFIIESLTKFEPVMAKLSRTARVSFDGHEAVVRA